MDQTEEIAERYLKHLGLSEIVYEPDGNVPPDFVVARRIAIEVRRLNQHVSLGGRPEGLEVTQFQMLGRVRAILESLGPPNKGSSWFVHYRYRRPVEHWKSLKSDLVQWLKSFQDGPQDAPQRQMFGGGFEITLIRSSVELENLFVLGGFVDRDASGWLLHELRRNIAHCLEEKSRKTAPYRHKYPEWWLLLIDQIGYALSDYEREIFRQDLPSIQGWDRVVLISPLDHTRAFVL